MINEFTGLLFSFILGLALGYFHHSILRRSVEQLIRSGKQSLFFIAGFILRMALSILVFFGAVWFASWKGVIASLAGFLLVRTILIRRWGPEKEMKKEDSYGNQP